ncbi:PQQ-binding-like beta-propeller repeat protein [Falsihalocynthiibacter sp. SS001]|uniref:PQQ-like beta-propeller repeat protein n=1 Tax=Falsihalocynthiibacter sp. SS001 TaxID=3349698 RepID=UPI0036D2732D
MVHNSITARDVAVIPRKSKSLIAGFVVAALLAACGNKEEILQGERLDIRAPMSATANPENASGAVATAPSFAARRASVNGSWTHTNGSPQHLISHPALGTNLRPLWSVDIGEGDSARYRISTNPVASGGRIYTMDSRSQVMAHATNGGKVWSRNLTPPTESRDDTAGGGLAISGDILIASTGFGELVAMSAATGGTIWTQRLDAVLSGPPTIYNGLVYAVTRDNVAWALNLNDGRIQWQLAAAPSDSGILGAASPSVNSNIALFPFSSGEIIATFPKGGLRVWSASLAGRRAGAAYAGFNDITSDPVIVGGSVYAGNAAGRTIKVDRNNGEVIWTATEGAYGPVWPEGNSVFLINDQAALVRLNSSTGQTLWKVDLPYFTEEKIKKRKSIYAHYGPVLAGGRLWVGSSDGALRSFNPTTGALLSTVELPGGATSAPIVVGQTLYIVTKDGSLRAFR